MKTHTHLLAPTSSVVPHFEHILRSTEHSWHIMWYACLILRAPHTVLSHRERCALDRAREFVTRSPFPGDGQWLVLVVLLFPFNFFAAAPTQAVQRYASYTFNSLSSRLVQAWLVGPRIVVFLNLFSVISFASCHF